MSEVDTNITLKKWCNGYNCVVTNRIKGTLNYYTVTRSAKDMRLRTYQEQRTDNV